jgi:hypothetical protein
VLLNGLVDRPACGPILLALTVSSVVDLEPIDLMVFDLSGLMCTDGGEPMTGEKR